MEKINLPFFYQLGGEIKPITAFVVTPENRVRFLVACFRARASIRLLLDSYSALTVCRTKGEELAASITNVEDWIEKTPSEKWRDEDGSIDYQLNNVVSKAKEFDIVLSEDLPTLATYHVTQKGIYSIPLLIDRTEEMLPNSTRKKIGSDVVEEIRQSGRCLAFDNSTASGFHIIRAVEAIMHDYYVFVCKPASKEKLSSWADYISALYKLTEDTNVKKSIREDVKKVVALLQQIKDQDRNLIMHPEVVLTPDDAHKLFEIAKGAIIAMADGLRAPRKKK